MDEKFNSDQRGTKTVLVAPLDWGLGHTTRCIPIINDLLNSGNRVILAGNPVQQQIFATEFPGLDCIPLEGYGIRYGRGKWNTIFRLITQLPKLTRAISRENAWLKEQVKNKGIDMVISDNRYGLYNPAIHSVILTHQLAIRPPWGKLGMGLLQKWNYRHLEKFNACWVPDWEEEMACLAGELSHPQKLPAIPLRYIGPLSRFTYNAAVPETNRLLIILSGPEPGRTIWEEKLMREIAAYTHPITLIRGLPRGGKPLTSFPHLEVFDHLPAHQLQTAIEKAEWIIARAGYSTIMDLTTLQKKAILIPTPGQSEQEYLANYLQKKGIFFSERENSFSLKDFFNKSVR
ncbi:MAG: glycosyl transferase family 28 [Chitinophagales bacterium]|nr:glycosyl transferase family 28 [Chitinophagales bacterium]